MIARSRISTVCLRFLSVTWVGNHWKIFSVFVLPLFDYADGVWDNCTIKLADELGQLHLDAIRAITGAVRGTSLQSLYVTRSHEMSLNLKFGNLK